MAAQALPAVRTLMAVYTDVPDDELRAFIAEYPLGEVVSCKGIAEGVENSNYLLRTERGTYILTLYERRVAPADLPFFLALMEHLAAQGIACPTPLHGKDGAALRQLCGRPAAIVTFLDGMWPRRIQPYHCAGLGRAAGARRGAGWRARRDRTVLARRAAPRRHPCRSVSRQRLLPRRQGVGAHRFLFRLHGFPRLRHRHLPQCLVLRAGRQLQRDEGAAAARQLPRRAPARAGRVRRTPALGPRRRAALPADPAL